MQAKNDNEELTTEMMKMRQANALSGLESEMLRERLNNLYKSMTKLYKIKKIQTYYEAFISKLPRDMNDQKWKLSKETVARIEIQKKNSYYLRCSEEASEINAK